MSNSSVREGGDVIPFPAGRIGARRLTTEERQDVAAWSRVVRHDGYAQATICHDIRSDSDWVLAYWKGELWTVLLRPEPSRRFVLSRRSEARVATFATLHDALQAIIGGVGGGPSRISVVTTG
jgi:hypothetical protein